jgi:hypothetical protein
MRKIQWDYSWPISLKVWNPVGLNHEPANPKV